MKIEVLKFQRLVKLAQTETEKMCLDLHIFSNPDYFSDRLFLRKTLHI
jgi:hypothetical protein